MRKDLASCNEEIERINKRITFYKDHPEIASRISRAADRLIYEKKRQELESLYASISTLQRKRDRLNNRIMKLKALLTELNSLNIQLKNSRICCLACGSTHVGFVSGDLSFDLTNELVRKNIIQSIKDNIQAYTDPIIIDCFRKGELSTKKENAMIEEYRKTRTQVILSATLKDEEYTSGSKYYDMPGVNAIDYEMHQDSHILQNKHVDAFGKLVRSFGVTFT